MKRNIMATIAGLLASLTAASCSANANADTPADSDRNHVVAYVTSWSNDLPDPNAMTHINYAFGHVSETFDSVGIANPKRLETIAGLKQQNSDLKVLLSIGGWGSGRFSEMAADSTLRASFAASCRKVADKYNLDGIDIDWEYPGSGVAGISASPDDKANYTLLMRDIRNAIGSDRLLTLASAATPHYIDFVSILPYIDFVNLMTYDMGNPPYHHSPLYKGNVGGDLTVDSSVKAHLAAGVPPSMLVVGVPFYGRGAAPFGDFCNYGEISVPEGCTEQWDSVAMAPYIADKEGKLILGYDNPRSLEAKCDYIQANGLKGVMYWDYSGDDSNGTLRNLLDKRMKDVKKTPRILVLNEGGGQHGPFTKEAMKWLRKEGAEKGFSITEVSNAFPVSDRYLQDFDCVIQLDFPPYTWPDYAQEAFIDYIDNGKGSWIGFHHATLLGDFDGYPMWNWFSDFMGGIRFQNYIAPLADGQVIVEQPEHPVMAGVDSTFTVLDDEWYTYDKSPRENVKVIARVDENSYSPASDVKMGDHPVVWTNPAKKAKNVYFQIGHSPKLLDNPAFTKMFSNSIQWALEGEE